MQIAAEPSTPVSEQIGLIHAGLGNIDLTFEWLDRAFEIRDGWLTTLKVCEERAPVGQT